MVCDDPHVCVVKPLNLILSLVCHQHPRCVKASSAFLNNIYTNNSQHHNTRNNVHNTSTKTSVLILSHVTIGLFFAVLCCHCYTKQTTRSTLRRVRGNLIWSSAADSHVAAAAVEIKAVNQSSQMLVCMEVKVQLTSSMPHS